MISFFRDCDQRVANGVSVLDRVDERWREQIRPRALDIASCRRCVLGQRFDCYGRGRRILGLSDDGAVEHGFHARRNFGLASSVEHFVLNMLWRRVVRA